MSSTLQREDRQNGAKATRRDAGRQAKNILTRVGTWEGAVSPGFPKGRRRGSRCSPACRGPEGTEGLSGLRGSKVPDEWQLRRAGGSPGRRLRSKPEATGCSPRAQRLPGPLMHTPSPAAPRRPEGSCPAQRTGGAASRLEHSPSADQRVPWRAVPWVPPQPPPPTEQESPYHKEPADKLACSQQSVIAPILPHDWAGGRAAPGDPGPSQLHGPGLPGRRSL